MRVRISRQARFRRWPALRALIATTILVTLLTACGGGGGGGGDDDAPARNTLTVDTAENTLSIDTVENTLSVDTVEVGTSLRVADPDEPGGSTVYVTDGAAVTIAVNLAPGETIVILQQPEHGTLQVIDEDTLLYTPDPNYAGSDTILYQVSTAQGNAISSITLNVTCPHCTSDSTLTIVWDPSYWLSEGNWEPAEGYMVFYGPTPGTAILEIANLSVQDGDIDALNPSVVFRAKSDLGLNSGDQACFRIKAYAWILESDASPAVCTII